MLRLLFCLILLGLLAPLSAADDVESFFRSRVLQPQESVDDAVCVFCDLTVRGRVTGDVVVVGGRLILDGGTVGQDLIVVAGDLEVRSGTIGQDQIVVIGTATGSDKATTKGDREHQPFAPLGWLTPKLRLASLLLMINSVPVVFFGLLLYPVYRARRAEHARLTVLQHPWRCASAGIAVCLLALVLITALGYLPRFSDPAQNAIIFFFYAITAFGFIGLGLWLGQRIAPKNGTLQGSYVGMSLFGILQLIPGLNILVGIPVVFLSAGALLISRYVQPPPAA